MDISFVVVTYQRGPLLQRCLDSIYMQEGLPRPFEIILVDNGGDAAVTPPSDNGITLHIERPADNLGAAGGRNLGMDLAQGRTLVLLDDDARWLREDDVARLVKGLEEDARCGAVCAKSLDPEGRVIVAELPHPDKRFALQQTDPIAVPYFYAVAHALRAEAIRQSGGYPPRYGIYMEEVDLSLRLLDAGFTITFDPGVEVAHHKSRLGRPVAGARYWKQSTLNKCRVAWRLLPQPYPWTTGFIWSAAVLVKTRRPGLVLELWRDLWAERRLLRAERAPIRAETVRYLRSIGARLWY